MLDLGAETKHGAIRGRQSWASLEALWARDWYPVDIQIHRLISKQERSGGVSIFAKGLRQSQHLTGCGPLASQTIFLAMEPLFLRMHVT